MIHYINDNYTINKLDPNKNDNIIFLNLKEGNNNAEYNTDLLQRMIEAYPKGQKKFFIKSGEYYFNSLDLNSINTNYLEVNLIGEPIDESTEYSYTKTKPVIIRTNKQDFLHLSKEKPSESRFNVANIWFKSYDGYSEIPTGVCLGCSTNTNGAECNFHLYNVEFHGYDYAVISKGYSCGASGGRRVGFSVCHYGIFIEAANHMFDLENVDILYCRVGIRLSHGGVRNTIRGVHVATGYLGADKDDFSEFIVIHTKGQTTVDSLYYEDYENTAQPEKTIIFDFEGWAYGCGHMTIKNTRIGKPGSRGGKWLRMRGYLGKGPEYGDGTTGSAISGRCFDHYPTGKVVLENCGQEYYRHNLDGLRALLDISHKPNLTKGTIFGLIIGFDIYDNKGVVLYGKPGYEMTAHINSKMTNGSYSTKTDETYTYQYISNNAWSDVQQSGLKLNEYTNEGLFSIQKDFSIKGFFKVKSNNIPDGEVLEFGVVEASYGNGPIKFFPITDMSNSLKEGDIIPVDINMPPDTTMGFPPFFAFGFRMLSDEIVDVSSYGINLDMNIEFKSI